MSGSRQFPDFLMRASAGLISGVTPIFKFGENQDIDTGTVPEDIIAGGGAKLFPTVSSTISIVSSSVEDKDVTGTGLRSVFLSGLDSNYDVIEETVILDGTGAVVTTNSFFRLHRVTGVSAGSSQTSVGNITFTHSEGTITVITAGHGQTQDATYTVPRDHILLIDRLKASLERTSSGAGAEVHFEVKLFGSNVWREQATVSVAAAGSSFVERDTQLWFPIPEKTDLRMRCSQVATNNSALSAAFDALLINQKLFAW